MGLHSWRIRIASYRSGLRALHRTEILEIEGTVPGTSQFVFLNRLKALDCLITPVSGRWV